MGIHGFKQTATAIHVHIPVAHRLLYGLPHSLESCEMDDGIDG